MGVEFLHLVMFSFSSSNSSWINYRYSRGSSEGCAYKLRQLWFRLQKEGSFRVLKRWFYPKSTAVFECRAEGENI